jgi:hypothetical protein
MKGRIYNALSRDTGVTVVESYELKIESFKAFQENQKPPGPDPHPRIPKLPR